MVGLSSPNILQGIRVISADKEPAAVLGRGVRVQVHGLPNKHFSKASGFTTAESRILF